MAFNPTPMQEKAINAQGNILIAAAAGSGKTAVLVERVISKLISKTNPVPADKLLIVTFTNAAAAEMRSRIEKRLDEECRKNPQDTALLIQKHLLSSAKICTIDSFCIDLVRENFEVLDISPDFKISDSLSLHELDEKVANRIVNRYLEEGSDTFFELLDIVGTEYDEKNFVNLILEIYNYSRQLPFPKVWFRSLSDFYLNGEFTKDCVWYKYCFDVAELTVKELLESLTNADELLQVSEVAINRYESILLLAKKNLELLYLFAQSRDWDTFYNALGEFYLPSFPSIIKSLSEFPEITSLKTIYSNLSKGISRLEKLFYNDFNFINKQFSELYAPIKLFSEILIEYDTEIFEEYKKNNQFTFHNTEHLALSLLCEEVNGEIVINPKSEELLMRFDEVMVDEYQDTNDLQDLLFKVLSDNEKKLFVVGDVKQSIYAFRGANPKNFLEKKNRYIPIENANEDLPQKIIFANNFRSKYDVCDFINYFFELFLNKEISDIVYNDEERLVASTNFPETNLPATEFNLIDCSESEIENEISEARHIAKFIKDTMKQGSIIRENDTELRPAKFSDFAILLRSAKLRAPIVADELKKQGIPVSFISESFAENTEISIFLNLLKVIDNPVSDVELLCVLMSPIFAFTAKELADIRSIKKDGSLYSAILLAKENGNLKAMDFCEKIKNYSLLSTTLTLPSFISYLLNDTAMLDIVSVMNDSERRRANLLLLIDYAEQFSSDTMLSPCEFSSRILKYSSSGMKSASITGVDAVKIMSIHASKGLQFPVCIISSLSSKFNDNEAKCKALYDVDFGIGFKYFDENLKTEVTTIGREAILDRTRKLRLEEELRLLYVAMTRAKDKLVMFSSLNNPDKKIGELCSLLLSNNCEINSYLFSLTKSYSDWLILALLLHPVARKKLLNEANIPAITTSSELSVKILKADKVVIESSEILENTGIIDTKIAEKITENISFEYQFKEILDLESKASVSKLANSAENAKFAFSALPSFMSEGNIKANERGTALHKVMQFFDFEKYTDVESEIERLFEWQYISETEKDSIDIQGLKNFFESRIFKRMQKSKELHREMRFLTEVPARRLKPELSEIFDNESIIVQGAVDVCFIEEDGIVILDFKTDRVNSALELANTYSEQLNIYSKACEKIFEKPVKEKIIYSFSLGCEIKV